LDGGARPRDGDASEAGPRGPALCFRSRKLRRAGRLRSRFDGCVLTGVPALAGVVTERPAGSSTRRRPPDQLQSVLGLPGRARPRPVEVLLAVVLLNGITSHQSGAEPAFHIPVLILPIACDLLHTDLHA